MTNTVHSSLLEQNCSCYHIRIKRCLIVTVTFEEGNRTGDRLLHAEIRIVHNLGMVSVWDLDLMLSEHAG
jgi:hypothetical protein